MNLDELSEEELKKLIECLPNKIISILATDKHIKVNGFRDGKAPKDMLYNNIVKVIYRDHNIKVTNFIEKVINDSFESLEESIKKYEKEYSHDLALSLSLKENYNKQMRSVYYLLKNMSGSTQNYIENNIALISYVDLKTKDIQKIEKINYLNEEIINQNRKNNDLQESVAVLTKKIDEKNDIIKDLKEKIENHNISSKFIQTSVQEIVDKRIEGIQKDYKDNINKIIAKNPSNNEIEEMKIEIGKLKDYLENDFNKRIINNISQEYIPSKDEEIFDCKDYELSDSIDDVILNKVPKDCIPAFKDYINTIIFSKKPIITTKNNSLILADILASIVSGGKYYVIQTSNANPKDVFEEIDRISKINKNAIYVLQNVISNSDYSVYLDFISKRPISEKFIFDVLYAKEIKFMPIEIFDYFNFFIGELNDVKIEYRYIYNIAEKPIKIDNNLQNILEEIGLPHMDSKFTCSNTYGILSYSILPFISVHDNINIQDLLNKIIYFNIRSKCEVVLNAF